MNKLVVKKWGWENAAELEKSPPNIVKDFQKWIINQVIVVSAIRSSEFNTTDKLIGVWNELSAENINEEKVNLLINEIRDFHLKILIEKWYLIDSNISIKVYKIFEDFKYDIFYYLLHPNIIPSIWNDYLINWTNSNISIIWFWEKLSAFIQKEVLNDWKNNWPKSENVDLDEFVSKYDLYLKEDELFQELSSRISLLVQKVLNKWLIPIVPGYIWWFVDWIENTFWRGYTDVTAWMLALGFSSKNDVTLEIQKSVKWMMSSDPRLLDNPSDAILIEKLDYLTAKEIIWVRWAQAKLLNSQVLRRELQEAGIKIKLFDPFSSWKWTIISQDKNIYSSWVEYIWWRKNIIAYTVSSWKMADSWVLFQVFQVVQDFTSIDIVSTSETEISFTLDWWMSKKRLNIMSAKIRKVMWIIEENDEEFVNYKENKALVFCVGQNLKHSLWTLWRASIALGKGWINIEMVSQWRMERAIAFCIDWKNFKKSINLLHDEFIWLS